MFKRKLKFIVEDYDVIDFVRLLGRIGLKFSMSEEKCKIDKLASTGKSHYRIFTVEGRNKDMNELEKQLDTIANYHRH